MIDRLIVRSQIQKQSYGFGTFAALRIAEIQEKSDPGQWWWTDGQNNPADMTTRYTKPEDLGRNSDWQTRPEFIQTAREYWPISQKQFEQELPDRVIVSLAIACNSTPECDICGDIDIARFSSYDKLIRVTARVQCQGEKIFEKRRKMFDN